MLLDVEGLTIRFGDRAPVVAGVGLCLRAGGRLGLAGASGAGKTLTARALAGVAPAAARVDGRIAGAAVGAVRIVVQQPRGGLDPLRRIRRQLAAVAAVHHRRDCRPDPTALLDEVGLGRRQAGAWPHQLSGGECQRAMIALGLASGARVLIADEPTASLDAIAARQILDLLAGLPERHGLGLILISHDPRALAVCEEVLELRHGRPVPASTPRLPARRRRRQGADGAAILTARDLSVVAPGRGGRLLVREASLTLRTGRTLALLGPSGGGKTTLARALMHLVVPCSGVVELDGQPLASRLARDPLATRRRLQMVFQDPATALDPRLTVRESLTEAARDQALGRAAAVECLAQVELEEGLLDRYPHQLSGGQKQRVALARALLPRPEVLVCDEPVASVDLATGVRLLALLEHLRDDFGLALLLISHDLGLVRAFADDLAVMAEGRIVDQGVAEAVLEQPRSPLTRELLAAAEPAEAPAHRPAGPAGARPC